MISNKDISTLLAIVNGCIACVENYSNLDEGLQREVEDLRNNFDLLYAKVDDLNDACKDFIGGFDKEG